MRLRFLGIVAALVLLAAACGGDDSSQEPAVGDAGDDSAQDSGDPEPDPTADTDDSDDGDEPEETTDTDAEQEPEPEEVDEPAGVEDPPEEIVLTDSFRGVTAEEIKIGVVIIDVEVFGRDNGDVEAKWQAAIDHVNDNGGVLGRRLVPVFTRYVPLGDTETEAACVLLTQDEQVFAAMGPLLTNLTCFTDVNETIFINTFGVSQEEFDQSRAVAIGPGSLPARSAAANVDALIDAGALDGPVAVHAAVDTGGERDLYVGVLRDAGVDVVSETESTVGDGDIVAAEAEMQSFAQRWQADGAEVIFAVGAGSGLNVVAGVDRSAFRPKIVVTNPSDFDPQLYRDLGYTTDALAGAVALGFETFEQLATSGDPGVAACIERFESASGETVNISPSGDDPVNLNVTIWSCQAIEIFAQVAAAAGADLTNDSFRAAAEAGLDLQVTAASPASISAGKFDIGDSTPTLLVFVADADDFVPHN